jgi:hypothetical protein
MFNDTTWNALLCDILCSCIPCGHVYGRSCLEKWLTQRGNRSATVCLPEGYFNYFDHGSVSRRYHSLWFEVSPFFSYFSALSVAKGLNIRTSSTSMHKRLLFLIVNLRRLEWLFYFFSVQSLLGCELKLVSTQQEISYLRREICSLKKMVLNLINASTWSLNF